MAAPQYEGRGPRLRGDDSFALSSNNLSSRTRTQSADAGPLPLNTEGLPCGVLKASLISSVTGEVPDKTTPFRDDSINFKTKNITPATALPIFPGLSLARSRVHEITGRAADGFVLSVLGSSKGNVIWTGRQGRIASLCPLAMNRFFDPARLITCGCISRKEILWSTEQALRSRGAELVVAEMRQGPNLRESRRLQLAAEAGRTLGLILIECGAQSSAAQTRWHCEPVSRDRDVETASPPRHSVPLPPQAGEDMWSWQLVKNKAGRLGNWTVEWKEREHEKGYVHMVSASAT